MDRSVYQQPLTEEYTANAAHGHDPDGNVVPGNRVVYPSLAATGLFSTTIDLGKALKEIADGIAGRGVILSRRSGERLLLLDAGDRSDPDFAGLGVFLEGDEDEREFFSYRWGREFQCLLGSKPLAKSGVIVMANGNPGKHQSESVVGHVYRSSHPETNPGPIDIDVRYSTPSIESYQSPE